MDAEIPEELREIGRSVANGFFAPEGNGHNALALTVAKVLWAERERCAKVCEQMPTTTGLEQIYANRIRDGWVPHA